MIKFSRLLKQAGITLVIAAALFSIYAFYITRNAVNMTTRQKLLKAAYPALMWITRLAGKNATITSNKTVQPPADFYALKAVCIDGTSFDFEILRGKKVLLVNTASDCGYTGQYAELEALYRKYQQKLQVIAFPANDFKQQEQAGNAGIAAFCKKNYGVSFPVMEKSVVINTNLQHPVYTWLTTAALNGWNNQPPSWNFSKYLVDETGRLVNYFGPAVSPLDETVQKAIEQ